MSMAISHRRKREYIKIPTCIKRSSTLYTKYINAKQWNYPYCPYPTVIISASQYFLFKVSACFESEVLWVVRCNAQITWCASIILANELFSIYPTLCRNIKLVGRLLCEHGRFGVSGESDFGLVLRIHSERTVAGCVWKRLGFSLQHSTQPWLRLQTDLWNITQNQQGAPRNSLMRLRQQRNVAEVTFSHILTLGRLYTKMCKLTCSIKKHTHNLNLAYVPEFYSKVDIYLTNFTWNNTATTGTLLSKSDWNTRHGVSTNHNT